MTEVEVWLSCYAYIFAISSYLTTVNQCSTMYFFFKTYVSLERSPLDEVDKSIKPLKKWKCQKCQRLTHFFIDEKNWQKFSLTGELISV